MAQGGAEIWFYHVERGSLEAALAALLEKCLARGWRALVCSDSSDRLAALDEALWVSPTGGFLPHGRDGADAARQPILLSVRPDNQNHAQVVFVLDGAELRDLAGFERICVVFDGGQEAAVALARRRWKEVKAAGHVGVYWGQDAAGRWERKA